MCDINFQNYSVEELITMKATIETVISDKKQKEYDIMVNKVLSILEVMAEKFSCEWAIDNEDHVLDWGDIYKEIRDSH
jgi:hypothetical protein